MAAGFEPEFTNLLRGSLHQDSVFLDVGAQFGYYTLLAAPLVRRVVAVEPKASACATLRENVLTAGLDNVTVIEKPLFSVAARGYIGRKDKFVVSPTGLLEAITLDSLSLHPTVIKIDVEGAEYDVLVGGQKTLSRIKPLLLLELHTHKIKDFGHGKKEVWALLGDLGYEITLLGKRGPCRFIKAS